MAQQRIVNVDALPLKDVGDGGRFAARIGRAGPIIGSTGLGCSLTVVPPGKRAWPFHRHHVNHELCYIISGEGECRIGEQALPVKAGDLIASPAGGEPHQLVNTSSEELRYLAFSTMQEVDIVEYPDSGKVGAAAGVKNSDFATATFKAMGRIAPAGYYDGESTP
jgi:uncharacterized cupin superfamily protein